MISLSVKKRRDGSFSIEALDGSNRIVAQGGGETPRRAAEWLIKNANVTLQEIEQAVIDLDLLPEREVVALAESAVDEGEQP